MINLLIALGIVGSFISSLWILMTFDIGIKHGWDQYEFKQLIKGFIGLVIFGNLLGWNLWYDLNYIQPTIDRSF